jgi:hypothetical protein
MKDEKFSWVENHQKIKISFNKPTYFKFIYLFYIQNEKNTNEFKVQL